MKIMYSDKQNKIVFSESMQEAITRMLAVAQQLTGIDFAISVLLTDNTGIAALNREFREIDMSTDVLSFPAYTLSSPLQSTDIEQLEDAEWEDDSLFVGDIAISLECANAQAEQYAHSIEREVAFLMLHGLLHLLGYDHAEPTDEKNMFRMQRKVMERAGIDREQHV